MFLVINNYDSFVYNLVDYIHQHHQETLVKFNDQITPSEIFELKPSGIFISPGPKHPKDAGNIIDIIQECGKTIPIFGICLGHQAIGYAFGADIIQVTPAHGFSSVIQIESESPIFKGLDKQLKVGRYHSLAIQDNDHFPLSLKITAKTTDTYIIMAVQHINYPIFGVQFHPESILSEHGLTMIGHFIQFSQSYNSQQDLDGK